jgi:hypothetical protein
MALHHSFWWRFWLHLRLLNRLRHLCVLRSLLSLHGCTIHLALLA